MNIKYLLAYLLHGAIIIVLPFEVEVSDPNTTGIGARQKDCAAVHCFQKGDLTSRHLQSMNVTHTSNRKRRQIKRDIFCQ